MSLSATITIETTTYISYRKKMNPYTDPEYNHSALITIDTQNDFSLKNAPVEIPGTMEIIPNMKIPLKKYREEHLPIIHVSRLYNPDGSNVDLCRKKNIEDGAQIVCPGTKGAELVEDLKPDTDIKLNTLLLLNGKLQGIGNREWIIYKPRRGAFYKTNLETHLKKLHVNTLVFCGCNFPNCPRTSIYEASERDFKIVLAKDAISGIYEKEISEMKNIGVHVISANDMVISFNDL